MIRRAREATGLHIAALSVALKVSVKKLEALESDRLDGLHDAVFVRGLAASVCRSLRIDPEPVLARLPQAGKPVLPAEQGAQQPFPVSRVVRIRSVRELFLHPLAWGVLALLVAAAAIAFLPELKLLAGELGRSTSASMVPTESTAPGSPTVAASASDTRINPPAPVLEDIVRPAPLASAPVEFASAAPPVAPVATVASAVAPLSPAEQPVLAFTATAQTWVEVLQADGTIAFKGMLSTGETTRVGGRLPLAVTVGRSDGVKVAVRGQSFDLGPVTKANVAHFEIK
jgi:cytoskeleton protein RodZ